MPEPSVCEHPEAGERRLHPVEVGLLVENPIAPVPHLALRVEDLGPGLDQLIDGRVHQRQHGRDLDVIASDLGRPVADRAAHRVDARSRGGRGGGRGGRRGRLDREGRRRGRSRASAATGVRDQEAGHSDRPISFTLFTFIPYLFRPSPVRCADPDQLNALGLVAGLPYRKAKPTNSQQRLKHSARGRPDEKKNGGHFKVLQVVDRQECRFLLRWP